MQESRYYRPVSLAFVFLLALAFVGTNLVALPQTNAQGSSVSSIAWTEQTDYGASSGSSGKGGIMILGNSCVAYQGYVYCIGGQTLAAFGSKPAGTDLSNVYFTQVSSTGSLGPWTETTDYGAASGTTGSGGVGIEWPSCVQYNGYVYCVAGADGGIVSKVFFAQLSSSGVGAWTETTDYGASSGTSGSGGVSAFQVACVADNGYIYCVGSSSGTSQVFYAQLSSSGVGPWTEATDYGAASGSSGTGGVAIGSTACFDNSGSIYCVGGTVSYKPVSDVFFAPLSSSGVGAWTETTDYAASAGSSGSGGTPIMGTSCVDYSSTAICVAGDTTGQAGTANVYYAPIDGLGAWLPLTAYLIGGYWKSCNGVMTYIVCVGGGSSTTGSGGINGGQQTTQQTSEQTSQQTTATAACDYTATKSGNWNDPSIWNPSPVSPFPATVPAGCLANVPSGLTVTVPPSVTVTSFGGIENYGQLVNYGSISIQGSTDGHGGFYNDRHGTVTNYGSLSNGPNCGPTNYGMFNNQNGGTVNVNGGSFWQEGTFYNDEGASVNIGADGIWSQFGSATTLNSGTITVNNGGKLSVYQAEIINNIGGTINVNVGGVLDLRGQSYLTNNGNIKADGTLSNNGGTMTGSGTLTVGGGLLDNYGGISNGGNLTSDKTGTISNEFNGTISNSGTIDNAGVFSNSGLLNNTGSIANSGSFYNSGTIEGSGSFAGNAVVQPTTTAMTQTTSSTSAATSPTSSQSSSGSSGGIPEFPVQPLLVVLTSAVLVAAYLVSRKRAGQ